MSAISDLLKRAFYLCFFIVPIPIGSYSIHNGSSAAVAMVSYLVLSILMPIFYLRSKRSWFFDSGKYIGILRFVVAWILVEIGTYQLFLWWQPTYLWALPTFGRDIVFVIIMYTQVALSLIIGYALSGSNRVAPEEMKVRL